MRIPTATYRIQFTADFGFDSAKNIATYLANLGVSDLYASPIFKAKPGSTHGYDVADPTQLNPELGSPDAFEALVQTLQQHQIGWLQDIVPNHMAYASQNQWLMDVLENGTLSSYVEYFDIAWNAPFEGNHEPILVPLLGNYYGECLENGEIQLRYEQGNLTVNYYSLQIPLKLESYATFLSYNLGQLARVIGRKHPVFVRLLGILYMLKNPPELGGKQRQDQIEFVKGLLWELYTDYEEVKAFIDENLEVFNGKKGEPESFNFLDQLLTEQHFRLAYWKVGAEEMNYRRFFAVNELISMRVEESKVFHNSHSLILKLVEEGKFTGLRIDHIDGLYDPTGYLNRLREKTGDTYITVEKILQPGEDLPPCWQVQGTSGYDYMNYVNGLFCQTKNQEEFDRIYTEIAGNFTSFEQLAIQKKYLILENNLAGDLDNLAQILKKLSNKYRYGNDFTINGLKRSLAAVLTQFPIYRTYTTGEGVLENDRPYIEQAIQAAKDQVPRLINELNFIEKLLLLNYDASLTPSDKEQWLYLVMRIQQYTGPLMAKGVEDTALYVYNRLLALNEVGGDPGHFGIDLAAFHQFNQNRQTRWTHTMNATSTHDTKRGEDVRARLNVLSEIPQDWQQKVKTWQDLNRQHHTKHKSGLMPDRNDEYAFYQTLVGAYPCKEKEFESFVDRVKQYMLKVIREAKVHTTWLRPNAEYENALMQFIDAVLTRSEQNQFLSDFLPFQQRIAFYGVFNSLSQTLLKIASPGVPDFYQGTELWDLSLVDPDNRRPVNFEARQAYLDEIKEKMQQDILGLLPDLLSNTAEGKIKLFSVIQALRARNTYHVVFENGTYQPLEVSGRYQDHIVAFVRQHPEHQHSDQAIVAIVPRFLTGLVQPNQFPLGQEIWQDTCIHLPPTLPSTWKNLITEQPLEPGNTLMIGQVFQHFPLALLGS